MSKTNEVILDDNRYLFLSFYFGTANDSTFAGWNKTIILIKISSFIDLPDCLAIILGRIKISFCLEFFLNPSSCPSDATNR